MKVQIEIEIPDWHEVVSVRSGSTLTHLDETESSNAGGADIKRQVFVYTRPAKPFLINGMPSDWPDWLLCDWVAKDKSGNVFGYLGGTPHKRQAEWVSGGASQMLSAFTALEIPGPWEQSLRENPRRKK